ncbi:hypothetical protein PCASD_13829 [Puccinia coronata f. sp. avenae]|uniref:Uncharacterized protein n=1 Tax=Puccinia coronata f. sp. avenae TaxID=200324 RepID=A0A2N5U5T7_9BASI|nr:hypothetical protein PCASD_13829 [Puccinia coronata f. sp. avenae]
MGPADPKISELYRTSLVNHSSLFLIYSILFPNTVKRQWSFLSNLYSFSSIDHIARSTHLKILSQFAKFLKPCSSSSSASAPPGLCQFDHLNIVLKKFFENLNLLKSEYSKLKERKSAIQGRLFSSTGTGSVGASSSSRDIFKKDSVEYSTLKSELKEITDLLTSRIHLIVQIFHSLLDLFSFHLHDLRHDRLGVHPLIYPALVWLDPSWTVGLEGSSLAKEKTVMSAFNQFVGALLDRRRMKLGQVVEYKRRVKEIEDKQQEEARIRSDYPHQSAEHHHELVDQELGTEKSELKEEIEAVYELDRQWIARLISVLPSLLAQSIESFIHDYQGPDDEDAFYTIGIELAKSLGAIDQLKGVADPHFLWVENFRSVDQWLGSGLSSKQNGDSHLQSKSTSAATTLHLHKNKYSLRIMKISITGLMSYLIGNLGAYYQEDHHHRSQPNPSPAPSPLEQVYRGAVRMWVLRVWMSSLTFFEYTLQLPFSCLIIHLEAYAHSIHPDPHELFGSFVPPLDAWNRWLVLQRLPAEPLPLMNSTSPPSSINELSLDSSFAKPFESKRFELFDLIFGEMKRHLGRAVGLQVCGAEAEGGIGAERYVRLYKELLGAIAESISATTRRLNVVMMEEAAGRVVAPREGRATDAPPHPPHRSLLAAQVAAWKDALKHTLLHHLPLHQTPPPPRPPPSPSSSSSTTSNSLDALGLLHFFNFISFPKLGILKSFLGIM